MIRKKVKFFIVLAAIAVFVTLIITSPVFYITEVEVTGINTLKKENITASVGLNDTSKNIFAFNSIEAKKILMSDPYVSEITINKVLPGTVRINIKERVARGCIQNLNSFLYIDGEGRVLETRSVRPEKLPLLLGLNFEQVVVGKILDVQNTESFEILIDLNKQLEKYELYDKVSGLDISDTDNIHIFANNNNLDICFGKYINADWKISAIKEILAEFNNSYRGQLIVGDNGGNIVFVPYQ